MKLCLNMIVKNEAHVIEETLNNLKEYICYWVISDTGSTDKTKEIITTFFKENKIPGELLDHEWEDFGTNRTLALEACWKHRKNFDYIWVFDGDDLVMGNLSFPKLDSNIDYYSIKYGEGFTYMRNQIFKSTHKWRYVGVLHEYPECVSKKKTVKGVIGGEYHIESRRLGDRNKAEDKYVKDAQTLEKGLIKEPDNERYMFYLGQSYMDAKDYKNAIKWYTKRAEKGKWFEEVYYSLYRIATCMESDGELWDNVEKSLMKAWKFLPSRAEPLYDIAKHYRLERNFEKGYKYAKLASTIPFPKDQVLFIFKSVYDYQVLDELSICAYYLGKHRENIDICKRILREGLTPSYEIPRIQKNMDFSKEHVQDVTNKKLIFYVGYAIFENEHIYGSELALMNLAIHFSKFYEVSVFGKNISNKIMNGIRFLNSNGLENFYNSEVDVCIISRYVHYLIEYPLKAKKTYIWLHDVCYHGSYNGFNLPDNGRVLVDNSLHQIDGIITLTNWHKNLIMRSNNLTPNKLKVIGNGISKDYFKEYSNFDQIKKIPYRFIYTSDVCRGLEELVDYFVDVKKEFPLAVLYIYRDVTSFKDYPKLLEKIKDTKYIHYSGKLEQKQLIHEFIKSDMWVYPTTFTETFCMSGLEALRSGCYCISTSVAALQETIGNHGVLIEGDPKTEEVKELFMKEIRKAFQDNEHRRKMQREAFEWAKTQTWDNIADQWLKMIE